MKFYRLSLSLLLVFVLSFGAFSITANAEEVDATNVKMNYYINLNNGSSNLMTGQVDIVNGGSGVQQKQATLSFTSGVTYNLESRLTFINQDTEVLFKKGRKYKFYVENIYYTAVFQNTAGTYIYGTLTPDTVGTTITRYGVRYTDGSYEYFTASDDVEYITNSVVTGDASFSINFTPKQDVERIIVYIVYPFTQGTQQRLVDLEFGALGSPLTLDISVQSEEAGLLGGILGKITDLWKTAEAGFANMVKGITELPQKLWDLISEGLKGLFVPDQQYMANYSDKWDELLSQRFGAIYEVGTIITDFADRIQVSDKTNTIYFPSVSLNSVGIPFTFGGYDVQVVPNGFDALIEVCKKIISIACTFLFINGLRKRYDEVMGVEQ